jgi:hypothetical protein
MNAPFYIVSKGRWDSRLTAKSLDTIGVDYYVVVEESEWFYYASVIDCDKLLILDPAYQRDYETCDELGSCKSKGPGPARNFAWDHSISIGADWHWVADDNIRKWIHLRENKKRIVSDGYIFSAMEEFVGRYSNIAMAGPNYEFFAKHIQPIGPFVLNTRIYSCNLIRNDVPFRWRCRYNEDTILSIDMLKAGWCTVQFNAFLQGKVATQTLKGGNTDEFYIHEGTTPKSAMLVAVHPDCARLSDKFGRDHHYVDFRRFRQRLKKRESLVSV